MKGFVAAVIAAIVSLFGIHQAPAHTASTPPSAQVAAAVSAVEDPFHPASNDPRTTAPQSATIDSTPSPQTTIVKQPARLNDVSRSGGYITQPVIERIIQSPPMTSTSGRVLGASTDDTAVTLADLQNQINALANLPHSVFVPSFSGPAQTTPVNTATFAQSQRIDQLSGTSLSNITVNGVSGLTDADIPALSYLPLSGGIVTGDLTVNGSFSGGSFSLSISSNPILVGSTTAAALTGAVVVRISGNYAYTVGGSRFAVIDISKAASPTVVGSINDSTNINTNDVGGLEIAGNYAYVGSKSRFTIIDISNPTSPQVVGSLTSALFSATDPLSVYISGKYAFIASGRGKHKFISIDISNPAAPCVTNSVDFAALGASMSGNGGFVNGIYVQGRYAYIVIVDGLGSNNLLQIYDVSNPIAMSLISQTSIGGGVANVDLITSIIVDGKYAYIGGDFNTLWIADVSNPSAPVATAYNTTLSSAAQSCGRSIYKAGKYLYGVSYFTAPAVCVFDASDPTVAPSRVGYTASPFGSTSVTHGLTSIALSGHYLYTLANNQNYFLVYDVTGSDLPNARIGDLRSTNLHISGNADFYNNLYVQGGLNVGLGGILSNGPLAASSLFANTTLGIGTSTPWGKFAISLNSGETNTNAFIIASSTASATTTLLVVTNAGNVGIATTSPWRKLSVTGTVGLDGLGSTGGTLTLCLTDTKEVVTNNGACTSSSEFFKHDIIALSMSGIDLVSALTPSSFVYNNDASSTTRWGFIAQQLASTSPHFIDYFDAAGNPRTIDTTSILAITVKAVQELIAKVAAFADSFTTKELTFTRAEGDSMKLRELCLADASGTSCYTRTQLDTFLQQTGQFPAAALADPAPQSSPTTGDQPADAATSSPAVTESAPPATEPTTPIADSPPLAPEEELGPTPATTTEAGTPAQSTSL